MNQVLTWSFQGEDASAKTRGERKDKGRAGRALPFNPVPLPARELAPRGRAEARTLPCPARPGEEQSPRRRWRRSSREGLGSNEPIASSGMRQCDICGGRWLSNPQLNVNFAAAIDPIAFSIRVARPGTAFAAQTLPGKSARQFASPPHKKRRTAGQGFKMEHVVKFRKSLSRAGLRAMLAALATGFAGTSGASAQSVPSVFHHSPSPWHAGGRIDLVRADMHAQYAPGSCLRGTFYSAAVTALEIPGVRVREDAEFWFHNARPSGWNGSPWRIDRAGTRVMVGALKPALRDNVLARVGDSIEYRAVYTGAELIRQFGFKPCG